MATNFTVTSAPVISADAQDGTISAAVRASAITVLISELVILHMHRFDTVTVTDAITKFGYGRALADTATMADAVTSFSVGKSLADTVTMSEGLTCALSRPLADTVTMSEAAAMAFSTGYADTVTMSEAAAKTVSPVYTDTVTMSDGITTLYGFGVNAADTVAMADSIPVMNYAALRADTVTMSDAVANAFSTTVGADSATMSDAAVNLLAKVLADTVTMSDSAAPVSSSPSFVGIGTILIQPAGTNAIPYPAGTQAGDVAFIHLDDNSSVVAPSTSGWTSVSATGTFHPTFRWKVLTSGDLSATFTTSFTSSATVLVFRNIHTLALKGSDSVDPNTPSPGFTSRGVGSFVRDALHIGTLMVAYRQKGSATTNMALTAPSMAGLVTLGPYNTGTGEMNFFYDIVASDYVSSSTITFALGTPACDSWGLLAFELT